MSQANPAAEKAPPRFWWWLSVTLFLAWLVWDWWPARFLLLYSSALVGLIALASAFLSTLALFCGGARLLAEEATPSRALAAAAEAALTLLFAGAAWDWWQFRAAFLTLAALQAISTLAAVAAAAAVSKRD